MFQKACTDLLQTIMPIVVAWKVGNKVGCGIGAGMILNAEGHFVTAGHILKQISALDQRAIGSKKGKQATHYACLFGTTGARLEQVLVQDQIDLGVGKLRGYEPSEGHVFPRLRTREVEQGELLCRLGYPFVDDIRPTWDPEKGFIFSNLFPVPQFANEAMVSRFAQLDGGIWIETSSPGLKGQSGGPLADPDGLICGIQVNTHHYPLGFEGKGRNQFLNVGRAVHVRTVRDFLDFHSIKYSMEELGKEEPGNV